MSERWGSFSDVARLGERIAAVETTLPLLRAEMDRQFRQLHEDNNEMKLLIRSQTPAATSNTRLFYAVMAVGGVVTLTLVLMLIYWFVWLR